MPVCYLCNTKRARKWFGLGGLLICRKCTIATLKVWLKNLDLKTIIKQGVILPFALLLTVWGACVMCVQVYTPS